MAILTSMFDFHLHLCRIPTPAKVAELLKKAAIGYNNIACEPWEWEKSMEIGEKCAFGIHPMIATKVSEEDILHLETLLKENPKAQVGECGLDKRFDGYEIGGIQEQILQRQIELSKNLNRPLHIHCVGDYMRIVKMIESSGTNVDRQNGVIFHRFGGDISVVKVSQKLSPIFSLHKDSFRKKSTTEAIKAMDPEQVRFETDADEGFICETDLEKVSASSIVQKIQNELTNVQRMYEHLK